MTELKKIIIEVAGKRLEFTPEEAKELKSILSDLFGGERIVERIIEKDYWHWWRPYTTLYDYNSTNQTSVTTGTSWSVQGTPNLDSIAIYSLTNK